MQVKRDCSWESEMERELERRWRAYKRRESYHFSTAWVVGGLAVAAWLIYWAARIALHR